VNIKFEKQIFARFLPGNLRYGYNAGKYEDLMVGGIIGPFKVCHFVVEFWLLLPMKIL